MARFVSLRGVVTTLVIGLVGLVACAVTTAQAPQSGPYRKLVPGIETTIAPDRQPNETISNQDLVELKTNGGELLTWPPQVVSESQTMRFAIKDTAVRRAVWCLEFTFKPMRMIPVDFPGPNGKMQQKLVWYLVYRVKNTGQHLQPVQNNEGAWDVKQQDELTTTVDAADAPLPIRFIPHFSLETLNKQKAYLDRVIPVAIPEIIKREDPNRKLLNSAEIGEIKLPVSTKERDQSVWGVATWEDVDPRIDQFSIYIGGLSNAYRYVDPPGGYKPNSPPGTGRVYQTKYLQLNFWRPSDEFNLTETPIYYGLPQKDAAGNETVIDSRWIFR